MTIDEDALGVLTLAVDKMTTAVTDLNKTLKDDYPKRSEIEQRFVKQIDAKRRTSRLLVLALITVCLSFVSSAGVYSACFVGASNSEFCQVFPGYDERVERRDQIDRDLLDLQQRVRRLERRS